jgi:hypothetical protein
VTLAVISFFALAILGLGVLSNLTDADIITVPGLGQAPGVIGMIAAVAVFAGTLWAALRRGHPSFLSVPVIGLATALAHLGVVWAAVLVATGDLIVATVVAGELVRGGASLVLLLVAVIAGWGGVALRRTRAEHPRWPWERDDEE